MIDAVLSYHLDPTTCGTARFNQQLATRLAVPCRSWRVLGDATLGAPLLSIKRAEWPDRDWALVRERAATCAFRLLMHGPEDPKLSEAAQVVYRAGEMGIPNLLQGDGSRGQIHVISFGMSHKRAYGSFLRLKALLDETERSYTVAVSSAVHERQSWSTIGDGIYTLRTIFGHHVRGLGCLADDGLIEALETASAVALFYEPAARRYNSTLWAALTYARTVITNLDADSPPELVHGRTIWDIGALTEWPDEAATLREMRAHVRHEVLTRYSWGAVFQHLGVTAQASRAVVEVV